MEGIINLPIFIISSFLIIIAPGPDFIYVTSRGISEGNRAGLMSALGISIGLLIHTLLAAFGLSAIIQASRIAYLVVKYIGAGYLIYLGVKMILSKTGGGKIEKNSITKQGNVLKQGIVTNVFNPKAIVTFMAFLPQFVNTTITSPIEQFLILGIILSILAVIWFGIVGYFSGMIGEFIKRSKLFQDLLKIISGLTMIGLGLRLVLKKE